MIRYNVRFEQYLDQREPDFTLFNFGSRTPGPIEALTEAVKAFERNGLSWADVTRIVITESDGEQMKGVKSCRSK